jgi:oligopeptide transport system substrate-binding protein
MAQKTFNQCTSIKKLTPKQLAKPFLIFAAAILFLWGGVVEARELKVLMLEDGSSPYAENASGDILSTFNRVVLGQLLYADKNLELQPGLLSTWKWNSQDGSYDLTLKSGLKFHDGSDVTAADLEFNLLRGFFSKQRSFYEIYLKNILGVEDVPEGTAFKSGIVKGVSITGPLSVKVRLRNPNPSFLYSLTIPYFSLRKHSALNNDLLTWKHWPIGAGTFKVAGEDNDRILLTALAKAAPFDQISVYKRAANGVKFDVSFSPNASTPATYASEDASAVYTLFFTNQNALSALKDFRDAIYYGVDRSALIKSDPHSKVATEFLPSAYWRNKDLVPEYNVAKAKLHFAKVPDQLRSRTWRIPVFSFGPLSDEKRKVVDELERQFAAFGFKAEFYPSSEKFLNQKTATDVPMRFTGRICDNADPLLMFSSFQTDSPYRYDNSQNDKVFDGLFSEAAKAIGSDARVSTLRKLSKYTIEHRFMLPLYENLQILYFNPKTVESFGHQPTASILTLQNLRLQGHR